MEKSGLISIDKINMLNWLQNIFAYGFGIGAGRNYYRWDDVSRTTSGEVVTADNMLTQSTVYAAVYCLASGVASVDFNVVKKLPQGGKAIDYDHPYYELIAVEPNEDMSARAFREAMMVHLLTRGNAYVLLWRNGYDQVVEFYLLDPILVQPLWDSDGTLFYMVAGSRVEARDIVHVAAPSFNGVVGSSPVHHLRNLVGVAQALDKFAGSFFGNGCNIKGILKIKNELDDLSEDAQANLRQSLKERHSGSENGNHVLILEEGMDFQPTSTTPDEAQFTEAQKLIILKIAIAFNLPPTKLGLYDHTALNTLEETNVDFFNSSLFPWVDRISQAFNRKLFDKDERKVHGISYSEGASLKGRMQDRVAVWSQLKTMGVLNTNEVRADLGLPPIPNGDVYMVQSNNYTPLDQVVNQSLPDPQTEQLGDI